jgi:DNA-binding transcriptional regulator YdaS (Cro superfamily)
MKKPNPLFAAYVHSVGGRRIAACRLGVTVAMVGHLITGERKVSPRVAMAIDADSRGHFSKSAFCPDLWPVEQAA